MNTLRLKRIIYGLPVLLIIVGASILISSGSSSAAGDVVYVWIESIPGPSMDINHLHWIEVSSFSIGVSHDSSNPSTGQPLRKPVFGPLKVIKSYDMASPKIALRAAFGTNIPMACVEVDQNVGEISTNVIHVTLEYVSVSSVDTTITEGTNPTLMEVVSLTYGIICWQYTPVSPDGTPGSPIATQWNVNGNVYVPVSSCVPCPQH